MATGAGTKADLWVLKTPPGTSEYTMYRDEASDPPTIVCQVGGTKLPYDGRAISDLHTWLMAHGDWMPLGGDVYYLHDQGVEAVRAYVERVWGDAAARFRLVARNAPPAQREP